MKKYLILLASAMLAWSCGDDKNVDEPQKPEPPVTEAAISLSASIPLPRPGVRRTKSR